MEEKSGRKGERGRKGGMREKNEKGWRPKNENWGELSPTTKPLLSRLIFCPFTCNLSPLPSSNENDPFSAFPVKRYNNICWIVFLAKQKVFFMNKQKYGVFFTNKYQAEIEDIYFQIWFCFILASFKLVLVKTRRIILLDKVWLRSYITSTIPMYNCFLLGLL